MTESDDADRFAGTATYYAAHRPRYGEAAIRHLADRFALDDGRVLDLGCGAGQVTLSLAAIAGDVVGMDPNEAMLREGRRLADRAGVENVSWVLGSDADLGERRGPFRLVTMGRAFHWMDQERTLGRIHELTEPGGGVAILGDEEWLTRGTSDWQGTAYAVAGDYVEDLPERTGPVEYEDPWDELVAEHGYVDVTKRTFDVEREWDVDDAVGYVLSLSFCSPGSLGDDQAAFESDLRDRLRAVGDPPFTESTEVTVISGRSDAAAGG